MNDETLTKLMKGGEYNGSNGSQTEKRRAD